MTQQPTEVTNMDPKNELEGRAEQGHELSPAEMEAESGAALPDREAMSLLDLNVDLDLALDLAAPIDAAVAANANVAAPIDAAVSANTLSPDATSMAVADQDSIIAQDLDGEANATANQDATIEQGETAAGAEGTEATTDAGATEAGASTGAETGGDPAATSTDASAPAGADTGSEPASAGADAGATTGTESAGTSSESGSTGASES
jgi:hypothetical protein